MPLRHLRKRRPSGRSTARPQSMPWRFSLSMNVRRDSPSARGLRPDCRLRARALGSAAYARAARPAGERAGASCARCAAARLCAFTARIQRRELCGVEHGAIAQRDEPRHQVVELAHVARYARACSARSRSRLSISPSIPKRLAVLARTSRRAARCLRRARAARHRELNDRRAVIEVLAHARVSVAGAAAARR